MAIEDDYCTDTYETRAVGKYCLPIEMNYYRELIESEIYYNIKAMLVLASSDFYVMQEMLLIGIAGSIFGGLAYHILMLCSWKRFNRFYFLVFSLFIFMGLASIMLCAFMDLYSVDPPTQVHFDSLRVSELADCQKSLFFSSRSKGLWWNQVNNGQSDHCL